ncbi:MAG TPA: hypothetical protein VLB04_07145 [Methanotrichaceae archaeon]|nr:hypothetical protein [Methanotrichaceae archaeon]
MPGPLLGPCTIAPRILAGMGCAAAKRNKVIILARMVCAVAKKNRVIILANMECAAA